MKIKFTKDLRGRILNQDIVLTNITLEEAIQRLKNLGYDITKLSAYAKRVCDSYKLNRILGKLRDVDEEKSKILIRENILNLYGDDIGDNCLNVYLVAYCVNKYPELSVISAVKKLLNSIELSKDDKFSFNIAVEKLAEYLGYQTREEHLNKLYQTVSDKSFHVAFEADKYQHIAITFHSSKGLEFEQVIVFAEDYRLSDMPSIYNHYVSVTRAKNKLVIVKLNNYNANCFQANLSKLFLKSGLDISDIVLPK